MNIHPPPICCSSDTPGNELVVYQISNQLNIRSLQHDEGTRLECQNVGFSAQFLGSDWINCTEQICQQIMFDFEPGCDIIINLALHDVIVH